VTDLLVALAGAGWACARGAAARGALVAHID